MGNKTSLIAILTTLATVLGVVAKSDAAQQFVASAVAHHPVLAVVGTVLSVLAGLLHVSPVAPGQVAS